MIIDNAKFLEHASKNLALCSLKTYSDTLLFYYLGYLAVNYTRQPIAEIGVGGSSAALQELSEKYNTVYYAIDNTQERLDNFASLSGMFPNSKTQHVCKYSDRLSSEEFDSLGYIHLDGDKNRATAENDLVFAANALSKNGIICQDDYGNNKWPSITRAVHNICAQGNLKPILIGDSSIWLVKPENHSRWMSWLRQDSELKILSQYINLSHSNSIGDEDYFYMNYFSFINFIDTAPHAEYYKRLDKYHSKHYLQMPYKVQSRPGQHTKHRILDKLNGLLSSSRHF